MWGNLISALLFVVLPIEMAKMSLTGQFKPELI